MNRGRYLDIDWPALPPGVGTISTLRSGGVSRGPYAALDGSGGFNLGTHVQDDPAAVAANRALLRQDLPAEPAWLNQVHGSRVADAAGIAPGATVDADASVAAGPGAVCIIQTADCLPVLFSDVQGRVVGAAHAGWRGLSGGVLENTLARMRDAGAGEIVAWLGPAIGPGAFEVGEDVRAAFRAAHAEADAAFRPIAGTGGKFLADIYALARLRLRHAGVANVSGGGWCTVTEASRFYSYRRDRVTGRMASLIWLK
ncbi:peptidoglycan editing factor PgeF [Noviherbaspirillum galbum]|uniref:Purine nucleoside phosphorylase n=1 Tax=Noviherbaspirillum galbum TaxID=2709383 RepID=A0A6B3SQ14_9BURK|nr:peptidoglycan editing factor PgeF [Noviherbaspirillum galbum]NEX59809.1 peptidoglycan editing factor PgeF [Noviherbaspirillum galbum]